MVIDNDHVVVNNNHMVVDNDHVVVDNDHVILSNICVAFMAIISCIFLRFHKKMGKSVHFTMIPLNRKHLNPKHKCRQLHGSGLGNPPQTLQIGVALFDQRCLDSVVLGRSP